MSADLAIRNYDDLMQVIKLTAVSNLLPDKLRGKTGDIGVILMYGLDLGMSPMQAIQGIYVVNGRPTLAAQTWLALARRAGHRISVVEHTAEKCTVKIVRGDTAEEHTSTYTYTEAEEAKLATKDVWKQHRKAMLLARAVSQGCRFICPEVAMGFYAEGEIPEDEPTKATSEVVRQDADAEPEPAEPVDAEVIQTELADIAAGYVETGVAE